MHVSPKSNPNAININTPPLNTNMNASATPEPLICIQKYSAMYFFLFAYEKPRNNA